MPPTGSVDKKPGLTCENGLIHRFHRPYYYPHRELGRFRFSSGSCAQLVDRPPRRLAPDLTASRTECRRRTSDWSPASVEASTSRRRRPQTSEQQQEAVPVKIRVERDVLAEAVAWAARSLPARPPVPVLAGLLLKAEEGTLSLSGFDYEVSARVSVEADVEEDGTVLVSGQAARRHLPRPPQPAGGDFHRRCTGDRGLRLLAIHTPHPACGGVPGTAADADRDRHRGRRGLRLRRQAGGHRRSAVTTRCRC